MGKKHIEIIARAIAEARTVPDNDSLSFLVRMLADRFSICNDRFDRERFFSACEPVKKNC